MAHLSSVAIRFGIEFGDVGAADCELRRRSVAPWIGGCICHRWPPPGQRFETPILAKQLAKDGEWSVTVHPMLSIFDGIGWFNYRPPSRAACRGKVFSLRHAMSRGLVD